MFAVVTIGGKQHTVAPGDRIVIEKVDGSVGDTLTFDHVLLSGDGKKTEIGTPTLKGVTVKAKVIEQGKGEKLDVYRFKSKVRYRRHIGFRPMITKLEIVSVGK